MKQMNNAMTSNDSRKSQFRRNALSFGIAVALATNSYANPTGMAVVAGQASMQNLGSLTQITNTPGAIINWQQFNIDAGQTTQFLQQNAQSQVFNRVVGGDISQILGTLKSNGQVFLINPAGVFFGQGSVIDTAGFLASTMAASNADLMNGHLKFSATAGSGGIVNQGSITTHSGGSIVLLAPDIQNSGIIHADGEVLLSGGHSVTIVDMAHPTIGLTIAAKEGEKAINLGQIIGKNVSVFSSLIRNTGHVEATGVQVGTGGKLKFTGTQGVETTAGSTTKANGANGGTVELTASAGDTLVAGTVSATGSNGKGGTVVATGNRVAVLTGAEVNASGTTGGGTIHIGGGWQGKDASVQNSTQTVIQSGAVVSADATVNGNGGEVVAWSDGATTVHSALTARGGALGGNGGRVETSGKQLLTVDVAANTSAAMGKSGEWLLDPANLIVTNDPSALPAAETFNGITFVPTTGAPNPAPTDSFIQAATIVVGLQNNGAVTLLTGNDSGAGSGNIVVNAPVLINSSNTNGFNPTLNLQAAGSILINADVGLGTAANPSIVSGLNLNMQFNGVVTMAPPSASLPNGANLKLGNGDLYFSAGTGSSDAVYLSGQVTAGNIGFGFGTGTTGGSPGVEGVFINNALINVVSGPFGTGVGTGSGSGTGTGTGSDSGTFMPVSFNTIPVDGVIEFYGQEVGINNSTVNAEGLVSSQGNTINVTGQSTLNINYVDIDDTVLNLNNSTINTSIFFNSIATSEAQASTNLSNQASLNLFDGFAVIENLSVDGTARPTNPSVINLHQSDLILFNPTTISGTVNLFDSLPSAMPTIPGFFSSNSTPLPSKLSVSQLTLEGTLNANASALTTLSPTFAPLGNLLSIDGLAMGAGSVINIGAGATLTLGDPSASLGISPSNFTTPFTAAPGATINLTGSTDRNLLQTNALGARGAVIDLTELDGQFGTDASTQLTVNVTGYGNGILTKGANVTFLPNESSTSIPVSALTVGQGVTINVNSGADGRSLRIGQNPCEFDGRGCLGSTFSTFTPSTEDPTVAINFNGTLNVSSGRVLLEGSDINLTSGTLSANGSSSRIAISGSFDTNDLQAINRSNGGLLALKGNWDNSANTLAGGATLSPLLRGDVLVFDDLVIEGGVLNNGAGGATNLLGSKLRVAPDTLLELQNVRLASVVDISPTSGLLLAAQDDLGVTKAPSVLDGALINMGGDAFLVVEADAAGNAILDSTANVTTIRSGNQGNLILAGRRIPYDSSNTQIGATPPDSMSLTVGSNIVLDVTGQARAVVNRADGSTIQPPGLALFNASIYPSGAPDRPVFAVGKLTPEAVSIIEYRDNYPSPPPTASPSTTILTSFDNPSFTVDGNSDAVFGITPTCNFNNTCVKFDVDQSLIFNGSVMSTLGTNVTSLSDAALGVVYATNPTLNFTNGLINSVDELRVLSGTMDFDGTSFGNGKKLTVVGGRARLKAGSGTQSITGLISNSGGGTIEILSGANWDFSGGVTGSGMISNSGVLRFSGGSQIGNFVMNNSGANLLLGTGAGATMSFAQGLNNMGTVVATAGGVYSFGTSYSQSGTGSQLIMDTGSIFNGPVTISGGLLAGKGTFNNGLTITDAAFRPGTSPGTMIVNGDLNLGSNSNLVIEVQGNGGVVGVDYDFVSVSGFANLGGTLNIVDISNAGSGGGLAVPLTVDFLTAQQGINGSFSSFFSSLGTYSFNEPTVVAGVDGGFALRTMTTGGTTPTSFTTSTGSGTTSTVSQNLNQAFVPPPTSDTPPPPPPDQQTQEEQQAQEVATQQTAGTTAPPPSNVQVSDSKSDPKRPAANCK